MAFDDIMGGEPCICITTDGVYVATRYKRVMCKSLSSPVKTIKDLDKGDSLGSILPPLPLLPASVFPCLPVTRDYSSPFQHPLFVSPDVSQCLTSTPIDSNSPSLLPNQTPKASA